VGQVLSSQAVLLAAILCHEFPSCMAHDHYVLFHSSPALPGDPEGVVCQMVQYFPCLFGFLDARELEAVHSSKQNKHLTYEI